MRKTSRLVSAALLSATAALTVSATNSPAAETQPSGAPSSMRYSFDGRSLNDTQYKALLQYNESLKDIQTSNWPEADKKLRAAIAGDPDLYQARSNHALVLARMGQLAEAKQEADMAVKLAPNKPEPIAASAAVAQASGDLEKSATLYADFVKRFPNHPMAAYARSLVQQLHSEANKISSVRSTGSAADKDYFDYATYDAVTRWNADRFPLKVYIPSPAEAAKVPGYHAEFAQALQSSFADWSNATRGVVTFEYVDSADDADIACHWTNDPTQVAHPAEGGEAKVLYDPIKGIHSATITLLTHQPDNVNGDVPVNLIKAASLHEVGHSLGLIGHSPNADDVMFCSMPAADQPRALSARDAATMIHLYRPDVKLASHYHDSADPTDKISLNNEGIKYASEQQFGKAVDKFEAVLKIDPNFEPSKRNLSACLNNMAIEAARSGRYPDALRRLQRALELEGNNGDRQKRISILRNLALVYGKLNKPADVAKTRGEIDRLMQTDGATAGQDK